MENSNYKITAKDIIAVSITLIAAFVTISITLKVLYCCLQNKDGLNFIGQSLFPLIGTWMGTILAFYFAKENFDAASKQYNKIIEKLSPEQKLSSIFVKDVMIPINKIKYFNLTEYLERLIIKDITANPDNKDINRFLFFDGKICKYIIHRSTFDGFIIDSLSANPTDLNSVNELKLSHFLNSSNDKVKKYLSYGIVFIKQSATLLEAKVLFDNYTDSQDVIITQNGKSNEEVIGWLTDITISENLKS